MRVRCIFKISNIHNICNTVSVLVIQSCRTLCNPKYHSPPYFSVRGILQERILEWIAIPFSRDLSELGIEPRTPALQAGSLLFEYSFSLLFVDSVLKICQKFICNLKINTCGTFLVICRCAQGCEKFE